MEICIKK